MAAYDAYNAESEQVNIINNSKTPDQQLQNENGSPRLRRISIEHSSLTGLEGTGRRSFSSTAQPVIGEGQGIGTYLEGKDLSRRHIIHRSHLSSSITTGISRIVIND